MSSFINRVVIVLTSPIIFAVMLIAAVSDACHETWEILSDVWSYK